VGSLQGSLQGSQHGNLAINHHRSRLESLHVLPMEVMRPQLTSLAVLLGLR
jgi:hypothetical protein